MAGSVAEKVSPLGRVQQISGIKTGTIDRIDETGSVWVDFPGNLTGGPVKARLTAGVVGHLHTADRDNLPPVMLAFEENDPGRPLIVDLICDTLAAPPPAIGVRRNDLDEVRIDGETVTFDAKKEIVLRCGKASITLTRASKVLIRGAYLLNRSSGVNRIKGGSVQIN